MKREQVLALLKQHQAELQGMGIARLAVFGSVARDEASPGSDVDFLVEFARPVGLFHFLEVKRYLEEMLGCKVDLATPGALKRQFRENILREAIYAV